MAQIISYKMKLVFKNKSWSWVNCSSWEKIIEYLHVTSTIVFQESDLTIENYDRLFLLKLLYSQTVIVLISNEELNRKNEVENPNKQKQVCVKKIHHCCDTFSTDVNLSFIDYHIKSNELEKVIEEITLHKYVKTEKKNILRNAFNHFVNRRYGGTTSSEY